MAVDFTKAIPILRIFSVEKAQEFYIGYLGFKADWEHRFEPSLPLYMQVSRGGLLLHLSEHHGDCTPGAKVFVETKVLRPCMPSLPLRLTTICAPALSGSLGGRPR